MLRYSHVATYLGPALSFVTNITDLQIRAGQSGFTLYSVTHVGGGFAAYQIGAPTQPISMIDSRPYASMLGYVGDPQVALVDLAGGPALFSAGLINGMGIGAQLNNQGGFGVTVQLQGPNRLPGDVILLGDFETPRGQFLYSARNGQTSFDTWRVGENGAISFVARSQLPWGDGMRGTEISDMQVVTLGDRNYMVSVSALGNYVAAQMLNADGTAGGATMLWADRGLGLNQPTHLTSIMVGSVTYVIVGSAQSSSLTTLRLTYSGELQPVDHIIDELTTRFRGVTALDSVTIDGRPFIFAGGGDDGISVFTMTPEGKLLLLATLADTDERALADVSALSVKVIDGQIVLFVASQTESGITQFVFDPGTIGITQVVGAGVQRGTDGNDMIQASAGTTEMFGDAGDDVLIAGSTALRMTGGDGADTFVPREVNGRIDILDFTPGVDQLDLSLLGMIRSLGQVVFKPINNGIKIYFGNSIIWIRTNDQTPLQASYFDNALFPVAHYDPPDMRTRIVGTAKSESLTASRYGSSISGGGGNDLLLGRDGDDSLLGGTGKDTIAGGAGNDTLRGEDGDDILRAHDGNDLLSGGGGNDGLNGGAGNDTLLGDGGNDLLQGDIGDDRMLDKSGNNTLWGGNGNDLLLTGSGNDLLNGGDGHDTLIGNTGNDKMDGSTGNDLVSGGAGRDSMSGGGGNDTLFGGDDIDALRGDNGDDYISGGNGNDVLDGGTGNDILLGDAGNDTLIGGNGNDRLQDFIGRNTLWGGEGNDVLVTGGGNDYLHGGNGNNRLISGAGNDRLISGSGRDVLVAGSGHDLLESGGGEDVLLGGSGNDTLNGGSENDTLIGQEGDDRLLGMAGNDSLDGQDGRDLISGHGGDDIMRGGAGDDTLYGATGQDSLMGESGNDRLYGNEGNDTIRGGGGNDWMDAGAGADFVIADSGNDTVMGGSGNDTIWALGGHNLLMSGDGDDVILAFGGNDRLYGQLGNDFLTAGAGNDVAGGGQGDDVLNGAEGADTLFGDQGNDQLIGGIGNDRLDGGEGDDLLNGGAGADMLIGGAGADRFVFTARIDFDGSRDTILDYRRGEDVIDMTGLNLTYVGGAQFSGGGGGQVRTYWTPQTARVLEIDLDGDGRADLRISIGSVGPLTDSDLLL